MKRLTSKIIPIPKQIEELEGTLSVKATAFTEKEEWKQLIVGFCQSVAKIFEFDAQTPAKGGVELLFDESIKGEGYILEIDSSVIIKASTYQGASYGLASVLQLMEYKDDCLVFERMKISDYPEKPYSAMMVDVAREWHPFPTLLKFVDVCHFFKIKYLHLHFMDNQGYTLPSREFPKLSKNGKKYTFEEIENLCDYAKMKGVTIIPEIEMPGHAEVLNTTYPEIFMDDLGSKKLEELLTETGVAIDPKSVICAGSEKAFDGIKTLIDETIEMFGDIPYIHLGGDEVNTAVWDSCSACKKYMEKNNIKSGKELYCEFTGRVTDYVLSRGITPIIWEGFSKEYSHMISKDVIVIAWESYYQLAPELLEGGYKIINGTWKPLYIVEKTDWTEKDIFDWDIYEWQNFSKKSAAYLNPIRVPETEALLGAQFCSWQQSYDREIGVMVRHVAAFTERMWSVKRCRDFENYSVQYEKQATRMFKLII